MTHLLQKIRKGEPIVSRKGPDLPGGRGDFANNCRDNVDDNNSRHDMSANAAIRNIIKQLYEGKSGGAVKEGGRISDGEAKGNDDNIAKDRVESNPPQQCSRKGIGGILDFFGCQWSAPALGKTPRE